MSLSNLAEDIKVVNDRLLSSLNPQQYEAVVTLDKTLLVLSGAGTGKTKVLTTKIAYIIENGFAFPSQILAATFSNRAAREMKTRLHDLCSGSDGVWLGTFHSICGKILRIHGDKLGISRDFTILDGDDQIKVIKQILKDQNIDVKKANGIVSKISLWKDKGYWCDDSRIDQQSEESKIYHLYQERIVSYDSIDFGDLLLYTIKLFKLYPDVLADFRKKFKYILVDEYQDTNMSQYMWLRMLAPSGQGLCCVGDDDQSIYSWRGAEVGNILRFEHDFDNTKIIRLEKNYRSFGHILGAASSLISHNENRLGKTLWTEDDEGEKVLVKRTYNGYAEAQFVVDCMEYLHRTKGIEYGKTAVLVRAGFQTREFEERFMASGMPYKIIGGLKFYDRLEIKDIIAYMRLIYQPNDSVALSRVINVPKRGIGAAAVDKIRVLSIEKHISLFQAIREMIVSYKLSSKLKSALQSFVSLIDDLSQKKNLRPVEIAKFIIDKTGYVENLKQENTIESRTRIENIKELLQALEDFEELGEFMEHVSLVSDKDQEAYDDAVNVLTLHSAKGLEFDAVFLVGWEEDLFPSKLSLLEGNLEEERRLAYVGITRARQFACITYAANRKVYDQWRTDIMPSRFIGELSPKDILRIEKL